MLMQLFARRIDTCKLIKNLKEAVALKWEVRHA
jgi:hypothetical protein